MYYENGAPLIGLCRIEEKEYLFDTKGFLQAGNAEGEIITSERIYFINPERNPDEPASCYILSTAKQKSKL